MNTWHFYAVHMNPAIDASLCYSTLHEHSSIIKIDDEIISTLACHACLVDISCSNNTTTSSGIVLAVNHTHHDVYPSSRGLHLFQSSFHLHHYHLTYTAWLQLYHIITAAVATCNVSLWIINTKARERVILYRTEILYFFQYINNKSTPIRYLENFMPQNSSAIKLEASV